MALLRYPIFANNGDTVELKDIYSGSSFSFDAEFTAPSWLTLNANNQLAIAQNAVSAATPIIVKLNLSRCFYLVVFPKTAPTVRENQGELSMLANSSFDLHLIVENADSITFRSGRTQPTGSSIRNGIFTIGTAGGMASFQAQNANGNTNFEIKINVVQTDVDLENASEGIRDRVEIAGIDVTPDVKGVPSISESLDAVSLNTFRANDAEVFLNSKGGKYNSEIANNFWDTNSLNANGYQERIHIYREYLINENWVSDLLFSGLILRATDNIKTVTVTLTCVDISSVLRNRVISDFGTLEKYAILDTDAAAGDRIYEYAPEDSLLPIQVEGGRAWRDQTELTLRQTALPTEGPPPAADLVQITATGLHVFGGFVDKPLLKFKMYPQYKSIEFLANQLALNAGLYQVNLDVDDTELENPYILNRGNVAFNVEKTRITRLPVDWVYDETSERLLILLSHPDAHISDLLVQRDIASGADRVLYEFDNDIRVYRIARLNSTIYYLLTTLYSESNQGSIYQYNTNTNTLTQRVAPSSSQRPIIGDFKCVGNNLYYEYSASGEVGVARLANDGTITSMIDDTDSPQGSPAFDVTDTEEIYLATIGGAFQTIAVGSYTGGYRSSFTYNVSGGQGVTKLAFRFRATSNSGSYTFSVFLNGSSTATWTGTGQDGRWINKTINLNKITLTSVRFTHNADISIVQLFSSATSNPPNDLKIQHRATDGTVTTLSNDVINTAGTEASIFGDGTFQVIYHNNYLYLLYKSRPVDRLHQDRLNFVRYDVSGNTIPLPGDVIIDANTNTLFEPLHLFIHADHVHFMRNTDLGAINRIEADGSFTNLGNLWYEGDTAWNRSIVRPLSIGDEIHCIMGYGDTQSDILSEDADASQRDNIQHLIYGKTLRYVIRDAALSGSIFSALAEIAKLVDATLSIENGIIHIRQRRALTAEIDGATGTGTRNISFENANRVFPSEGYLWIGDEFIEYTGIRGDAFTGIRRGVLGTEVVNHADESQCIFLNQVISEEQLIGNVSIQADTARLYNVIQNNSGSIEVRDAASIEKYGEKVLTLNLSHLTDHDRAWQETIFERYLENLKDLRNLITFKLPPTRGLRLGDVIGLRYTEDLLYVMQIVSRTNTQRETAIRGLTLPI